MWLGVTILLTGLVVGLVVSAVSASGESVRDDVARIKGFVGDRFARVWDDPRERHELGQSLSRAFTVDVTLRDANGAVLDQVGDACTRGEFTVPIRRGNQELGRLEVCAERRRRMHGLSVALAIAAACMTLWVAAGALARKLVRPLSDLIRVTREIGSGKLTSRVRIGRRYRGEIAVLAEAVNDMAQRIERQLSDQRELLAAVSHEIRSPLARVRVLLELLRSGPPKPSALDEIEREIVEVDELLGKLLASSRLDFDTLSMQPLALHPLVVRALEHASVPLTVLHDAANEASLRGDATLLDRALGNLLENAQKHGRGVDRVEVSRAGNELCISVSDRGPGFPQQAIGRVFDAFYRAGDSSSLGLGLALVARIARAHGGRSCAENREGGGATVQLYLPAIE
jgi:signal transduction histidine kinase